MGYTHYFDQVASAGKAEWAALKAQLCKVFLAMPQHSTSAGGYYADQPLEIYDGFGERRIDDPRELFQRRDSLDGPAIIFNGNPAPELEHENFVLPCKLQDKAMLLDACATARKPYDWLVVATLILAHNECPGVWNIRSDGGRDDWAPVAQWLAGVLGEEIRLPAAVGGGAYAPDPSATQSDWRAQIAGPSMYF